MHTATRLLLALATVLQLAGCATTPVAAPPPALDLFSDTSFHAPQKPVRTDQLFALSPAMQQYVRSDHFTNQMRLAGRERGLFEALYTQGDLKLDYDAAVTRDAAGTFAEKKGNCLSLVIMTAAFAKALDIDVNFQTVLIDEQWSRSGSIYVASTHVNLNLPIRQQSISTNFRTTNALTIDFLPSRDAAEYNTRQIDENTIVAMYLNNRAAEELAANNLDEAYWWARAAVEKNPTYTVAYNTLGVVYQRHGDMAMAERVYKRALSRETEDTIVMHNLVPVLAQLGKTAESKALAQHLAGIDPTPPFFFFVKGLKAMEEKRYADAKALFAREVKRSPYYHEFHFWLALANWRLGDAGNADSELALAVNTSTSADSSKLYAGKLNYLRALTAADAKKSTY